MIACASDVTDAVVASVFFVCFFGFLALMIWTDR